jgi:hypothetical protein
MMNDPVALMVAPITLLLGSFDEDGFAGDVTRRSSAAFEDHAIKRVLPGQTRSLLLASPVQERSFSVPSAARVPRFSG